MAKHADSLGYVGDNSSEYPDALESLEPSAEGLMLVGEDEEVDGAEAQQGLHGKPVDGDSKDKKKKKKDIPPYMRKSRRTRKILIAAAILLVVLLLALGYFTFRLFEESRQLADDQAQQQGSVEEVTGLQQEEAHDASTEVVKKTSAPNLAELMGITLDQAIEKLNRGATVTSTKDLYVVKEADTAEEGESQEGDEKEENFPSDVTVVDALPTDPTVVVTNVTVALTEDPVDTRTGVPTVYLGLNAAGSIIEAGYSASAAALGYGTYSFVDAVKNNYIVERTLQEAGIAVPEGTAQLPEDRDEYATYSEDGVTLVKEYCPFSGAIELNGEPCEWSAVLSYDYSLANASGATNLSDTIRIIYIYVSVLPA